MEGGGSSVKSVAGVRFAIIRGEDLTVRSAREVRFVSMKGWRLTAKSARAARFASMVGQDHSAKSAEVVASAVNMVGGGPIVKTVEVEASATIKNGDCVALYVTQPDISLMLYAAEPTTPYRETGSSALGSISGAIWLRCGPILRLSLWRG